MMLPFNPVIYIHYLSATLLYDILFGFNAVRMRANERRDWDTAKKKEKNDIWYDYTLKPTASYEFSFYRTLMSMLKNPQLVPHHLHRR